MDGELSPLPLSFFLNIPSVDPLLRRLICTPPPPTALATVSPPTPSACVYRPSLATTLATLRFISSLSSPLLSAASRRASVPRLFLLSPPLRCLLSSRLVTSPLSSRLHLHLSAVLTSRRRQIFAASPCHGPPSS